MNTDNTPVAMRSTDSVSDASINRRKALMEPVVIKSEDNLDPCASLLARVDLKWLLAGQGWWIDPHRFESDGAYTIEVLRFALASQSLALRACASSLQTQLCQPVSH